MYRACVIGCGRIGVLADQDWVAPKPASHAGAWRAQRSVTLVAVCDADPVRAREASRALSLDPFTEAAPMVEAMRPDIVSVTTPAPTHLEVVREVCEIGGGFVQAIVCEKPLATSARDAREMVALCDLHDVLLFTNHQRRFSPLLQAEREWLRARIGTPTLAVGHHSGGLWEGGSHLVDLFRWFLGEADQAARLPGGHASLSFGGTPAVLLAHRIAHYVMFGAELYGEAGMIEIGDYGRSVASWRAAEGYPLADGYRQLVRNGRHRSDTLSLMAQMAGHVVAVLDGRAAPVSTGEDGARAVEILEVIAPWPG